jgi:hypothetical protein
MKELSMADSYARFWNSATPGCMIFLLDQSDSMKDPFANEQVGSGRRKSDMVATIFNSFLNELITINTTVQSDGTPEVKRRAEVCALGYQGSTVTSAFEGELAHQPFLSLADLQMNPLDIEIRKRKEMDDSGNMYEVEVPFPIWIKAKHSGGTPMRAALERAEAIAAQWADNHPTNYPPVIINLTDGVVTDGDPMNIAQKIAGIETSDGHALLFNVHITDLNASPVLYPASESDLPNNQYARKLFAMSSVIPETSRALLESLLGGREVASDARGMIFNGDASSIRLMFNFVSAPATQPIDPNR